MKRTTKPVAKTDKIQAECQCLAHGALKAHARLKRQRLAFRRCILCHGRTLKPQATRRHANRQYAEGPATRTRRTSVLPFRRRNVLGHTSQRLPTSVMRELKHGHVELRLPSTPSMPAGDLSNIPGSSEVEAINHPQMRGLHGE